MTWRADWRSEISCMLQIWNQETFSFVLEMFQISFSNFFLFFADSRLNLKTLVLISFSVNRLLVACLDHQNEWTKRGNNTVDNCDFLSKAKFFFLCDLNLNFSVHLYTKTATTSTTTTAKRRHVTANCLRWFSSCIKLQFCCAFRDCNKIKIKITVQFGAFLILKRSHFFDL